MIACTGCASFLTASTAELTSLLTASSKCEIKDLVSLVLSIMGTLVAVSALVVSYFNYRRDSGRLDIYVGLDAIHNGTTLAKEGNVINLKAVNSGRRPVIITNVGGDNTWHTLKMFLSRFFPHWISPRAFVLTDTYANAFVNKTDGLSKVLQEGQSTQVIFPLPEMIETAAVIASANKVYVYDSLGRKHFVRDAVLKKFKKDYLNYKNGQQKS